MSRPTFRERGTRAVGVVVAVLTASTVAVLGWLRADAVTDARGSDSSEKAFMVILAIALGGAVSAAAIAFVAGKTSLFQ